MRRMRICFTDVCCLCFFLFFFVFFRSPQNTRQPFSGTAERIFMKLLTNDSGKNVVSNIVPKWGLGPPNNFIGAKNWKIAIGAYSSELIFPERKRISERLKRLWNHETMAYKVYVRPWPLTLEVNTARAFACTSAKKFRFLTILSKFSAITPHQNFHSKQSPWCSTSVENFVENFVNFDS